MESVFTQKAARVLRVLMLIALGCNLIALFLVPTAVLVNANDPLGGTWTFLAGLFTRERTTSRRRERPFCSSPGPGAGPRPTPLP